MTPPSELETRYADILAALSLPATRMGVWALCGRPSRPHGWKLHLSSVQKDAPGLVRCVAPVLRACGVPFKVARDASVLGLLNEGLFGATQVGKFLTVYADELPPDRQRELIRELVDLTRGLHGPRVVTDAHLGGTVYCRYGEFRPEKRRNRLGLFESNTAAKELVSYRVPFQVPEGVTGADVYGVKDAEQAGRLELLGPGYLPIGTIASQPKGTIYLALDLRSQEQIKQVVLKQGRAGCMSDSVGRDIQDRLKHQAEIQSAVSGRVHTPVVESFFHHSGDAFLALELIQGFDLRAFSGLAFRQREPASRNELLGALRAAAREIVKLHDCGVVHRDLSPNNIRVAEDAVYLMDLELAHQQGQPGMPFTQGTAGYVSPQQQTGAEPAFSDDVYSFGAVIASLLTGFPGHLLPVGTAALGDRLTRLSGASEHLCRVAAACLSHEPGQRPAMADVLQALENAGTGDRAPVEAPRLAPTELMAVAEGGLGWLLDGAERDERFGMWLSPALESTHLPPGAAVMDWRLYRSASRGVGGLVYLMAKLWRRGLVRDARVPLEADRAVSWLLRHHDSPDDQLPGLHFGEAGVAVAICEALAARLIERGSWTEPYLTEVFRSAPDWPDLTHGAAGQGMAALYCGWLLGEAWLTNTSDGYAGYLLTGQAADGSWVLPPGVDAMQDKAFTGCAHGAAGIVHFLACHGALRGDARSLKAAERGGEWLLDEARSTSSRSGLSWALEAGTTESWHWWCHGAPGIALAFLSLYQATGEIKYAGAARACLRTIPDDFRAANLSQCHGLAGLGELLFEGYEVLGDADLLERGLQLASALGELATPAAKGLAWRVENVYSREPDLMTGGAGVVHLLARAAGGASDGFGMPLQLPSGAVRRPK